MTQKLPDYLKEHIVTHGPIDIGQYMALVLGYPEHGYYMSRDPFGRGGDFTTAPEISQMFGEVLGAYCVHQWMQLGQPERFVFLECGPGRGTLMSDMMRAGSAFPGFAEAAEIHLLEISPVLREKQAEALAVYDPVWHDTLDDVPDDAPILMIANEFLDALPVRQFWRDDKGWLERFVDFSEEDGAHIIMGEPGLDFDMGHMKVRPRLGDVLEVSPARKAFVEQVCALLGQTKGAALFVDYGHEKSGFGDTVQAVHKHEYCDILDHIGEADLTAHVDFEVLKNAAALKGAEVSGPVEQGEFLNVMGLSQRAAMLKDVATDKQAAEIDQALHRLTHADQMGKLFKVMGVSYG